MQSQRHLFSLSPDTHYLNCAFMAPVSDRAADAARQAVDRLRTPSRLHPADFFEQSDAVRRLFARLIGLDEPRRVAIVPSVSYALATVARNTPLSPTGNVVVVEEQFPSAVYTWRRACDTSGATLRTVSQPTPGGERGRRWSDAVEAAIDTDTAVVAIPELHWTDGTRFDLDRIGRRARECGARLIIDGTQSVGALPFQVGTVAPDALVCAGYKWLMGPYGVGLAYFGPAYDDGVPLEENWITRTGSEDFAGLVRYSPTYQDGAIRYDVGERSSFLLLPVLEAGLSQVLDWGPATIQRYCADLTETAIAALRDLGGEIESTDQRAAHLFGVRVPGSIDVGAVQRTLATHHVSVSIRGHAIRVSPHVYNDDADLRALVDAVRTIVDEAAPA